MSLVLGIESSCDDLGAALVRDGCEILSSVVHRQDEVHAPFGGVVPELASRDHVEFVWGTVERSLASAAVGLEEVDAIGVTTGPGLIGSLLVGLCFAKALAYRLAKPLVGVHHIEGHIASARLDRDPISFPFLAAVLSGGHSAFYHVESLAEMKLLGQTRDDAAGEAFDKVAKRLGLGYPGGREVDRVAAEGSVEDRAAIPFPRPMLQDGLDLSFSGLKTAVALEIARREDPDGKLQREDLVRICASFQEAVVDVIATKSERALRETGLSRLALVGGLAANRRLRERMTELATEIGVGLYFPPVALCTDNAAMIAAVADGLWREGSRPDLRLDAFSRAPLGR